MGEVSQRSLLTRFIARPKTWAGGGFVGAFFWPTIKNIFEGAGMIQSLQTNAAWWYSLPDQNWFQILVLFGGCFLIWRSLIDTKREIDSAASQEAAMRAEIVAQIVPELVQLRHELRPALETHNQVGNVVSYARHYEGVRRNLEMVKKLIADAQPLASQFESGRSISYANISHSLHPIHSAHDVLQRVGRSLDPDIPQQALLTMSAKPSMVSDEMRPYMVYDPEINGLFATNVKLNIEILQSNYRAIETRLAQLEEILEGKRSALWSKFSGTPI